MSVLAPWILNNTIREYHSSQLMSVLAPWILNNTIREYHSSQPTVSAARHGYSITLFVSTTVANRLSVLRAMDTL